MEAILEADGRLIETILGTRKITTGKTAVNEFYKTILDAEVGIRT